jgi:cell division protease FtsH
MVCEWGMSELGPLAFGKKEGEVFLGKEMTQVAAFSEETARAIDAEVHRIVMGQYARARAILEEHRATLQKIADALMEYETIDTADIEVLMKGQSLTRTPPAKPMATTQVAEKSRTPAVMPPVVPAPGKA